MKFISKDRTYKITRYPVTRNHSLQAWGAADEHILQYLENIDVTDKSIILYNDRFGFLSSVLNQYSPTTVIDYKSQLKACNKNFHNNKSFVKPFKFTTPLEKILSKVDIGIVKIPKSIDLFKLHLSQLTKSLSDDAIVICGFMTKYFTPQIISTAKDFFEEVEQSKALKKSRLLVLKGKKDIQETSITNTIELDKSTKLQQYFGVFSSDHIDYATQFLLENLNVADEEKTILDLASGNGIIARQILKQKPECEISLLDDSFLAVESSKLNISGDNVRFLYNDCLENLAPDSFDLVVSNPPFHFEHENNIEVSLELFKEVKTTLKPNSRFVVVANKHLNYKTHLVKLFSKIEVINENDKFVIYSCEK